MRLSVVAIGQRMPDWVERGWNEYARRFPRGLELELKELPMARRTRSSNAEQLRGCESGVLLAAVPSGNYVIAMDERGRQWSTRELAGEMQQWMQNGRDVSLLIGGPDGLDSRCLQRADARWSLGKLTLPHMLVRVILAEQLYRAWSVTQNHPYHRE
jgi:23S rRNA (pseudouridine1915-N3)-methyltransferase